MKKNNNSSSSSIQNNHHVSSLNHSHSNNSMPMFIGNHPPLPIGGSLKLATSSEPKLTVLQIREQIGSIMTILKRDDETKNPKEIPITVADNLGFLLHSRKAIEDEDGKKGKRRRDILSIKDTEDMLEKLHNTTDENNANTNTSATSSNENNKEKRNILKDEGTDLDNTPSLNSNHLAGITATNSIKSLNSLNELESIKSSRYHHLGTVATLSQINNQREEEEEIIQKDLLEKQYQQQIEKTQKKQLEKNRRYALSLATLSARGSEKRRKIVNDECISILIELLSLHPEDHLIQAYVASAFASLTSDSDLWDKILGNPHTISTLLTLITTNSPLICIKIDSLKALVNLSAYTPKDSNSIPCEERFAKESVPTTVITTAMNCSELRDMALQMLVNLSCVTEKFSRMEEMTESLRIVCEIYPPPALTEDQEYKVLEAFVNLSALRANQIQLVEDLCLPIIEKFCYKGNDIHKKMACEVLKNLTSDSKSRSKLLETSSSSIFSIIVSMLSPTNENVDIKLESATCLFFLSIDKNFRRKIIQSEAFYHLLEQCKVPNQSLELYRIISKILRIFCDDEEFVMKLVDEGVGKALISLMVNSNNDYSIQQSCTECVCLLFQYHDIMKKLLLRGEKVYEVIVNLSYNTKEKLTQEWCAYALYQLTNSQLCTDSTIQRHLLPCILHLAWGGNRDYSEADLKETSSKGASNIPESSASPLTKAFCAGAIACCSTPTSRVDCSKAIPLLIRMLDEEKLVSDHPVKPKEDIGFLNSSQVSTSTDWTSLVKYHCASALFNLSIEERNCHYMYNYDALTPVVKLTQISNAKVICAGIISRMSLYYKPYIHMYDLNVLRELLDLSNIDDRLTQRRVVIALSNLSQNDELRSKLLSLKPNKNIVKLASLRDEYLRRGCISIVCNISYQHGSENKLITERTSEDSNLLKTLLITSVITSDQVTTRIICVKTILNLMFDRTIYKKLVKEGVLWTLTKICSLELERERKLINALKLKNRRISPSSSRNHEEEELEEEIDDDMEGFDFSFLDTEKESKENGASTDLDEINDNIYEDINEKEDNFFVYDKEYESIKKEINFSNELIYLCSIAICRLSTEFSEHILQNLSELKIILSLLKKKNINLKRPLARIITNLLLKTTDKDEKIRQLIVKQMSPILDTSDSELNELCVVCLCLASQSELCREEIVSSGMLQKIDPSAIFSRDGTISYAYITMFSNIANNNGMVRSDVLDDNLVERLEKILAQSTIRNNNNNLSTTTPTTKNSNNSSPSKNETVRNTGESMSQPSLEENSNYENDFEELSKELDPPKSPLNSSSIYSSTFPILEEDLNSCDCDDDPKLRLAVMKALYCVSCATINVKKLVKQEILSFICRLLAIPDCTVISEDSNSSPITPSTSFVTPKLRKYKSYRNINSINNSIVSNSSFNRPPPLNSSAPKIEISSLKSDSKDIDLPKYTPEVIEQYEILFRFYLIGCLYNLTTCSDSLNELVCSGIMKIFNYLWPQAQSDNRTARLIILAITHLACGKTNSSRLVEDGATRILSFTTNYKQVLASQHSNSSYRGNYLNKSLRSSSSLNSNSSSTNQALLTPVPVNFTQDDCLRVSAALRNLLISVSNQVKMVEEGCLVTLVQLANQPINFYDHHNQIRETNPQAFFQTINSIHNKVTSERRKSLDEQYDKSRRSSISSVSRNLNVDKDEDAGAKSGDSDTSDTESNSNDDNDDDIIPEITTNVPRYNKSSQSIAYIPSELKNYHRHNSIQNSHASSIERGYIRRNCAAALRSLTFNKEIRHLLLESEAINIILNDITKEPDTIKNIKESLLKEIECESWENGNRVSLKEAKVGYSSSDSVSNNTSVSFPNSNPRSRKESISSNLTDKNDVGSSLNSSSGVSSNAGIYSDLLKGMSNVELNVDVKDIELIKYSVQIQLEDSNNSASRNSESPMGKSRNSSFSSESISFSLSDFTGGQNNNSPSRQNSYSLHLNVENDRPLSPTSAAAALARSFYSSSNLMNQTRSGKIRKTESFEFNTDKLDILEPLSKKASPSNKLRQSISLDNNTNENTSHLELITISYLTAYSHDESSTNLRSRAYPKVVCLENEVLADPLSEINRKTILEFDTNISFYSSSGNESVTSKVKQISSLPALQTNSLLSDNLNNSQLLNSPSQVLPDPSQSSVSFLQNNHNNEENFYNLSGSLQNSSTSSLKDNVVLAPLTHLHHQYHKNNNLSKSVSTPNILPRAGLNAISSSSSSPSSPIPNRILNQTLPVKNGELPTILNKEIRSSSSHNMRNKTRQAKSNNSINAVLSSIKKAKEGHKSIESVLNEWKEATRY